MAIQGGAGREKEPTKERSEERALSGVDPGVRQRHDRDWVGTATGPHCAAKMRGGDAEVGWDGYSSPLLSLSVIDVAVAVVIAVVIAVAVVVVVSVIVDASS